MNRGRQFFIFSCRPPSFAPPSAPINPSFPGLTGEFTFRASFSLDCIVRVTKAAISNAAQFVIVPKMPLPLPCAWYPPGPFVRLARFRTSTNGAGQKADGNMARIILAGHPWPAPRLLPIRTSMSGLRQKNPLPCPHPPFALHAIRLYPVVGGVAGRKKRIERSRQGGTAAEKKQQKKKDYSARAFRLKVVLIPPTIYLSFTAYFAALSPHGILPSIQV